jgi:hypothetical protein
MMIFTEVVSAPLVPLTEAEQVKLTADLLMQENLWIESFIDRLNGVIREIKH